MMTVYLLHCLTQVTSQPTSYPPFVARYDFQGKAKDDLSLKKGDVISIINKDNMDWWYAESKETGRKGFVPRNYIVAQKSRAVR